MKVFWLMLLTALVSTASFGQCEKLTDHPKGEAFAKRQFVYRDQIKAKKYEAAMPQWRNLYTHCRAGNGNILKDGETIYKYFTVKAEKAGDKRLMKAHMDTVGIMMTQRIECYGTRTRKSTKRPYAGYRYYLLGKHYINSATKFDAMDSEQKATIFDYYKKTIEAFKSSIKADGDNVESNLVHLYAFVAIELWKANTDEYKYITVDEMRALYDQLLNIAEVNKDKVPFIEAGDKVKSYYRPYERQIFDCKFFVDQIKPDFYANYDDPDYIKENIRSKLVKGGCEDDEAFYVLVKNRHKELIDSIRINDRDFLDWAEVYEREGNEEKAIEFYIKGVDDSSLESDRRFKAAMRLASKFQQKNQWSKSLEYLNKAASIDPNSGAPFIRMGMLYLTANKSCASFERQKVTSIAIDFFNKAKGFSDSGADASDKIGTYTQYLPTKEQVFQRGLKPGSGTTAGCVLKRSTTLRTKD